MYNFGLLGHPVSHSFSKDWMQEKFVSINLNANYELIDITDITEFKKILKEKKWRGFNVTIPYKQSIMKYLDILDETASKINAVNTIYISNDNKLIGYNTDVIGFHSSLISHIKPKYKYKAIVLGNGGASQAVQYVLRSLGIDYIIVTRSTKLFQSSAYLYNTCIKDYSSLTDEDILTHKLIINTTPLGMFPNINTFPNIAYDMVSPEHILFDLVYNPTKTEFLKKGEQHGAHVISGLEMLYAQAEASLNIWLSER